MNAQSKYMISCALYVCAVVRFLPAHQACQSHQWNLGVREDPAEGSKVRRFSGQQVELPTKCINKNKRQHSGCSQTVPGIREIQQVLALPSLQQVPEQEEAKKIKKNLLKIYNYAYV